MLFFEEKEPSKSFEITVALKDQNGNPTGKTKTFSSDDSFEIWKFYMRHQNKPKNKQKTKENLPSEQEAKDIMKKMYNESN